MPVLFNIFPDPKCVAENISAAAKEALKPVERPFVQPCNLLSTIGFSHGFPTPSDPQFCEALETSRAALEAIADTIKRWIGYLDVGKLIADKLKIPEKAGVAASAYNLFVGAWNAIMDKVFTSGNFAIAQVVAVLNEVLSVQDCVTPEKNRKVAEGVWVLKQLVHLIENVRAGVDPGIWVTVDIHPQFDLVKQWLDYVEKYFSPIEIPSPQEATRAWLLNRISLGQRNCIWALHGLPKEQYEPYALTEREQLDWREAVQYARRQGLGEGDEDIFLRARGFVTQDDITMAKEMFWELPGIADHLHWLQRQVFDTDYVQRYELMDGFDTKFWPVFGPDLTSLGMRKKYAEFHYAAHWIMPSPEQMKEFLYRSEEISDKTGREFSLDDFERILAEQDYNVLARKWFRSTAYNVPAISYVKEWYRQNIIGDKELQKYHRFLGYDPKDAEHFVEIDKLQKVRMRAAASHGWTTLAASTAWANGQISTDRHDEIYKGLGYTENEAQDARNVALTALNNRVMVRTRTRVQTAIMTSVKNAIDAGVVNVNDATKMLQQAGWQKDLAFAYTSTQGIDSRTKMIKQAINYIKRMVIGGSIDFQTAAQNLLKLGVDTFAANAYLQLWQLQLTPGRKHRSAAKVTSDLANGHIDRATAAAMLTNLGYNDVDTRLYLAEAQDKLTKIEQGRKAASQKAGLARSKQIAALHKAAAKQSKDLLKQLMRQESPSGLKRWAKLGIIGKDYFMRRFAQYGYTRDESDKHYAEACKAKGAACVDITPGQGIATPNGGSTGSTTGGGSSGPVGV